MATNKYPEHDLQVLCVKWFRLKYPSLAPLLFAVPNGAHTKLTEAKWLKAEGMRSGIADMILLLPNKHFGSLSLEFKSEKGKQSPEQADFESCVAASGGHYVIVRSYEEFTSTVEDYLSDVSEAALQALGLLHDDQTNRHVLKARDEYNKLIKKTTHERK